MVKSIYKKEDDTLKQQFIKNNEEIPDGWTADLNSLDIEQEPSEVEQLQNEVNKLKKDLSDTQSKLLDVQAKLESTEV